MPDQTLRFTARCDGGYLHTVVMVSDAPGHAQFLVAEACSVHQHEETRTPKGPGRFTIWRETRKARRFLRSL